MEPTTTEAMTTGGMGAVLGAILFKIIDKIPFASFINKEQKKELYKEEVATMLLEHERECQLCIDKKLHDQTNSFMSWRKEDIEERREFRREMLDSVNRLYEIISRK